MPAVKVDIHSSCVVSRFFKLVTMNVGGCWTFNGPLYPNGYGVFKVGERSRIVAYAHRYSYMYHHGDIPQGQQVNHSCDNRCCVNPQHLVLGTQRDNMADMVRKNRHNAGVRNAAHKLNWDQVIELRRLRAETSVSYNKLGLIFGISSAQARRVVVSLWRNSGL